MCSDKRGEFPIHGNDAELEVVNQEAFPAGAAQAHLKRVFVKPEIASSYPKVDALFQCC